MFQVDRVIFREVSSGLRHGTRDELIFEQKDFEGSSDLEGSLTWKERNAREESGELTLARKKNSGNHSTAMRRFLGRTLLVACYG